MVSSAKIFSFFYTINYNRRIIILSLIYSPHSNINSFCVVFEVYLAFLLHINKCSFNISFPEFIHSFRSAFKFPRLKYGSVY